MDRAYTTEKQIRILSALSESTYLVSPISRTNASAPSFGLWRPLPLHFPQRASKARGKAGQVHCVELSLGHTGRDDSACCHN